ncbi:MAG: IS3 family transposase [Thaumarchaeota archaeon]|nr:IS3 family transposase [Nitrososphaerota archaeon]
MIFEFMKQHSAEFPVEKMAQVFKVSRAGYYKHISSTETVTSQYNSQLLDKIKLIFKNNRGVYGSPRVYEVLKKLGEKCSRKRVAKIMKNSGIRAKSVKKRFKVYDKACKDLARIAPNIINQNFVAQGPNEKWVSDITYIQTHEGWLYVAAVMDLFSRKIVGLGMSDCIDTKLIVSAFDQAICHRAPQSKFVLHSDRGSQYTSLAYKQVATNNKALLSMSAKGYCYDNAAMESFFHTLKTEHVYLCNYQTRKEATLSIFEYIEIFYNRQRMHSTLGYLSPVEFEQQVVGGAKNNGE